LALLFLEKMGLSGKRGRDKNLFLDGGRAGVRIED
jgi:hypothetical protein